MLRYLNRGAAVEFICTLGVPMKQSGLEKVAHLQTGPRYAIINGRALYREKDLLAWVAAQAARPLTMDGRVRPKNQTRTPAAGAA